MLSLICKDGKRFNRQRMDIEASPVSSARDSFPGLNGLWKKPPPSGVRRSSDVPKDDTFQFFKEERTQDAIYKIYLKKVQYHVDNDMCVDVDDERAARLQWRLEEVRVIRSGTLAQLICALASETGELESTNVSIFLSTYRTFASAKEVMDELLKRYKSVGEDLKLKQQVRESHRRTIKTVLGVWLENYSEDFYDPPHHLILKSLYHFADQQMKDGELGQKIKKIRQGFRVRDESTESASPTDRSPPLACLSSRESQDLNANYFMLPIDLMSVTGQTFAEQLTFVDAELFKKVIPHHCLGSVWSRRCQKFSGSNQSPSVYATVEQFNAVTYRVIATIVKQPKLSACDRALIIQKWIDIAQECRNLKNFSSLKAIISGLQSAPVYRLHSVWNQVNRQKLILFDELSAIFSEEDNQRTCRELLSKEGTAKFADPGTVRTPKRLLGWPAAMKHRRSPLLDPAIRPKVQGTVPYLGTFLTDLMMLDTALKDMTKDGLINFEKRRKEFEILTQIKLLQSAASLYEIKPDQLFMKWFYQMRVYDDSESYELSLEIEPETAVLPTTPLVKGHQKKSSLGYFSPRNLSIASSMDNILELTGSISSGSISLTRHRRRGSDNLSIDGCFFSSPKLSHSASMGSLHSINSQDLISSPFRSEDSIVVKVYCESADSHSTNHYKSIVLRNSDHTRTLLLNAFLKYNITASPDEYSVSQILSNNTELRLPEKGNVFYAINTSETDIKCIIRKNTESHQHRTKPTPKMRFRKLQL